MDKTCENCGKTFHVKPSHYSLRRHCSRQCYSYFVKKQVVCVKDKKICTKCGCEKSIEQFYKRRSLKSGYSSWCSDCSKACNRAAIENNKDYYGEYRKEYYQRVSKHKKYVSPGKKESDKKYREKNKDRLRKKLREKINARRKRDPKFILSERVRHSIWKALRENKAGRRWEELVGYTLNDLHKHLTKTIPAGFSWADYLTGKLQIDHIIPRCAFNYELPGDADFKRCWGLKNLRLLTKEENYEKRAKITGAHQPSLLM